MKGSVTDSQQLNSLVQALSFPVELPITARREEIVKTIRDHQVVVLSGETGSGKSTQIPKLCLEAGRGRAGRIACTQPRRIAAISVAERVASELGQKPGEGVGYRIRFQEECGPGTVIKFLTDGMLLSEAHADPMLSGYDTIIIDEAHERSLNIDFLIGLLRNLLNKRPDLKLIITSATIDTAKFSGAFGNAPIIEVSGRTWPVEVVFHPPEEGDEELSWPERVMPVFRQLVDETASGDILIFMPTEQDILETREKLSGEAGKRNLELLPLYARLPQSEQQKIFRTSGGRKVIIATNIAETSLTIPGIKYVIDTGVARILHYHPASGTYGLPVEPVSRSSADQRKGRSGRVENGVCHRLYSEEDYLSRKEYTPPEIVRTNLAEVVLRMVDLGIEDIAGFPFIDPPSRQGIQDAVRTLEELGALKSRRRDRQLRLTHDGRYMARLPLDPRLSRVLLQAARECCLDEVLPIVAALTIQDPREYPQEKLGTAREQHARFADPASDFLFYLNLWTFLEKNPSAKETKRICKESFLSFRRIQEWRDIFGQLKKLVRGEGFRTSTADLSDPEKRYAAIHRSLLSGFLSHIAIKGEGHEYRTTRNRSFFIFPGSVLFSKGPEWGFALEYVKTARVYGRTMARIDPDWLPELGRHLIKRRHFNPRWDRKSGTVMIAEEQLLYGFVVKKGYDVPCGTVNPELAADLFVRAVFVDFDLEAPGDFPFLAANRKLIRETEQLENKLRQRGFVADPEELFRLFRERLPLLFDLRMLARYVKENGSGTLYLTREELLRNDPGGEWETLYPDWFAAGEIKVPLRYAFEPGQEKDGVSFRIPQTALPEFPFDRIDWAVPGQLAERIEATLRSLPKEYRKKLIPIQGTVETLLGRMNALLSAGPPEKGFYQVLHELLREEYGLRVESSLLSDENLPGHLRHRYELYGSKGELLAAGRNRADLYGREEAPVRVSGNWATPVKKRYERTGLKEWPGDFPECEIPVVDGRGKKVAVLYPALTDTGESAALRLYETRAEAEGAHADGVSALCRTHYAKEIRSFRQQFRFASSCRLVLNQYPEGEGFEQRLFDTVVRMVFRGSPQTGEAFLAHRAERAALLHSELERFFMLAEGVLDTHVRERRELESLIRSEPHRKPYLQERIGDLSVLMRERFFTLESEDSGQWGRLPQILSGVTARARKGILDPRKDRSREQLFEELRAEYDQLVSGLPAWTAEDKRKEVRLFAWTLLDWRTVLFSPEIRLKQPVSESSVRKELKRLSDAL